MKRKKRNDWVVGLIITLFVLATAFVFMGMLVQTKMFPDTYMIIAGLVLGILILLIALLTHRTRNLVRFIIGCLLSILLVAGMVLGVLYIRETTSAISGISSVNTQVTQVSVFVRNEDAADSVDATSGYTFGILQALDRENTDGAVQNLGSKFGTEIQTTEYAGLTELVDGLLNSSVNAIILNQAYLQVIEEMNGYADIESKIRSVGSVEVEKVIETAPVQTESEEKEARPQSSAASVKNGDVYTIYISGIDTRGEMTASSRSDVNILATVNTSTHQVLLVSTPRDYFVPLSISNGVPDKLTHAGIYGIDVCMNTLGMLYDIDIKYYFRINFGGFIQVIDALGGITVDSDYDFNSGNVTGYHFNKGANFVNGEQALVFARERYAFSEGDRQRGRNQMAVIKGVMDKAMSPELLTNYSSILSSLSGTFGTNISYEEIARLLQQQLKNGGNWNVVSYSVDGTGSTQKPYSMSQNAYVMVPDYATVDKAKSLMQAVREGKTITQEEANGTAAAN